MIYNDLSSYQGKWITNKRCGRGVWRTARGETYDGVWSSDLREGYGTSCYVDGSVYQGQHARNMREGQGKMEWKDGSSYRGEWLRDKRHGFGSSRICDSGQGGYVGTHTGQYRKGAQEGLGDMEYASGDVYSGEWHAGERCGTGKLPVSPRQHLLSRLVYQGNVGMRMGQFTGARGTATSDMGMAPCRERGPTERRVLCTKCAMNDRPLVRCSMRDNGNTMKDMDRWRSNHGYHSLLISVQGRAEYENGDSYTGGWLSDLRHGEGVSLSAVGAEYIGMWEAGSRHGVGK
jgi:hypothetical protein